MGQLFRRIIFIVALFVSSQCRMPPSHRKVAKKMSFSAEVIDMFVGSVQTNLVNGMPILKQANVEDFAAFEQKENMLLLAKNGEKFDEKKMKELQQVYAKVEEKAIEIAKNCQPFNDKTNFDYAYKYERFLIKEYMFRVREQIEKQKSGEANIKDL